MTTATHHDPSRREILSDLFDRLKRVQAAGGTIKTLVGSQDTTMSTLSDALVALERDLTLAAHEAERARARIKQGPGTAGFHGPTRRGEADGGGVAAA